MARLSMKPDHDDNPMLSAAARMLALTRRVVLDAPGSDQAGRDAPAPAAAPAPAPRARQAERRARQVGRRERIG